MTPLRKFFIVLISLIISIYMYYFLPGWIGILAAGFFFAFVVGATFFLTSKGRSGAAKLWKEFLDFLYGL